MEVEERDNLRRYGSIVESIDVDSLSKEEAEELRVQLMLAQRSVEKMKKIYGRLLYRKDRKGDTNSFYSECKEVERRLTWKQ